MAGWLTSTLPPVGPTVQNGATVVANPISVNGTLSGGEALSVSNLSGTGMLVPLDTYQASGQPAQSVAASAFQIASLAASLIQNTATSTVHTATLNTTSGLMLTESLSTAAGATYTFQLVNSLITATSNVPQVQMRDGTNTAGAASVTSITNAAGTATVVFTNTGTAAWNGTKIITFAIPPV
jgi:hypothetical protein